MDTSTRGFVIRRGSDLGGAVAEARRARGLTQVELAERIGVNRAYLAAIEGGRANRLIEHLLRAFRRLGAEVTVNLTGYCACSRVPRVSRGQLA